MKILKLTSLFSFLIFSACLVSNRAVASTAHCDAAGRVCVGDEWMMADVVKTAHGALTQTHIALIVAMDKNQSPVCQYENGRTEICHGGFMYLNSSEIGSRSHGANQAGDDRGGYYGPGGYYNPDQLQCSDGDIYSGAPCVDREGGWLR